MESAENQPRSSSQPGKTENLSRIETIKLLNDSIDRLEQTIKNIGEDSAKLPSAKSLDSLLTTTQEIADTVAILPPPEPIATPTPPAEATTSTQVKTNIKSETPPEPQSKKIPLKSQQKNSISIALGVTAIAIAVVTIFWLWLPSQEVSVSPEPAVIEPATEIVTKSPEPAIIEPTTEVVTNLDDAEPTVETVSSPQTQDDSVEVVDVPVVETGEDIPSEEVLKTVIPEELESPGRAKNLKVIAIEPELNFTPEQTLVAALPNRISQSIKDYTDFVEAIEVNLPQSRLLVEITDDWYSLDANRQDKLANKMLERSRQLDFNKLELKDSSGKVVARSPVIGDRIVILESSKYTEPLIVE